MKLPQALPTLTGRWFAAYRILWMALFAGALLAATGGTWISYERSVWVGSATYGAGIRIMTVDGRITIVPIGDETSALFPTGSTLLAVDGRAVPERSTYGNFAEIARALGHDDGRVVRLSLRTPKGAQVEVPVRRGPHHLAQSDRVAPISYTARAALRQASAVIAALLLIVTAAILFRRRPRDPVVALLSTGFLLLTVEQTGGWGLAELGFADRQINLINSLAFCTIMLAIIVFPNGGFTPRWTLAITPALLVYMTRPFWQDDLVWLLPFMAALVLLFAGAALIWRFFRLPPGPERQQIKWAMFGFVGMIVLQIAIYVIGFAARMDIDNRLYFALILASTLAGTLAAASLCAGLLISLLRYRLYDADAAISRSATLAALTLSLIAVFAGTEKLIETLGEQWFGDSAGSAAGAIAAGLAAALLVPMHRRLDGWAERRFQRNLVTLRKLPELVGDLRETASVERLADAALDRIATTLRATGGAIVLTDGVVVARRGDGKDHPVRLSLDDEACGHVGELRLGPRPDGTLFGQDEREALASVLGSVARAIAITRERNLTETRWQRHLSDLQQTFESRLRAIEARLPAIPAMET